MFIMVTAHKKKLFQRLLSGACDRGESAERKFIEEYDGEYDGEYGTIKQSLKR